MKKTFALLTVLFMLSSQVNAAKMTFANAYSQNDKKPMMVLVYATWADGYQNAVTQFNIVQQKLGDMYNFVELDIAKPDAKSYSDRFMITPGLPYVMLFRDSCKISRIIDKNCVSDSSCMLTKAKAFID